VDLGLTAFANATKLYCNKKTAKVREVKTVQASSKVLGAVQEQAKKAANSSKSFSVTAAIRKVIRYHHLLLSDPTESNLLN
jgi:hypothetical protein